MTYDNDGPIYSMLSGKVLNSAPCTLGGTNTGNCTGYCDGFGYSGDPDDLSAAAAAALAECNGFAGYFGGSCLGVVEIPEGSMGSNTHVAYVCFPNGPPNYGG